MVNMSVLFIEMIYEERMSKKCQRVNIQMPNVEQTEQTIDPLFDKVGPVNAPWFWPFGIRSS